MEAAFLCGDFGPGSIDNSLKKPITEKKKSKEIFRRVQNENLDFSEKNLYIRLVK